MKLALAMRRTGHHAIVNWICRQHGSLNHVNNCQGNFDQGDALYSWEHPHLAMVPRKQFEWILIVLRDPRNWLASMLRYNRNHFSPIKPIAEMYITHLEQALGSRNDLPDEPVHFAIFDQWFQSRQYRQTLAQTLNLHFTDAGLQDVPPFGGGSSFDQLAFDGRAQLMNVLRRYQGFTSDPAYQEWIPQLMKLWNQIS